MTHIITYELYDFDVGRKRGEGYDGIIGGRWERHGGDGDRGVVRKKFAQATQEYLLHPLESGWTRRCNGAG